MPADGYTLINPSTLPRTLGETEPRCIPIVRTTVLRQHRAAKENSEDTTGAAQSMRSGSVPRHLKIAGRTIISRFFHVTSRRP
jgi:hypothetical protein